MSLEQTQLNAPWGTASTTMVPLDSITRYVVDTDGIFKEEYRLKGDLYQHYIYGLYVGDTDKVEFAFPNFETYEEAEEYSLTVLPYEDDDYLNEVWDDDEIDNFWEELNEGEAPECDQKDDA